MAALLLAGLMSDTLILRSPTTTARDRRAAEQLAAWGLIAPLDKFDSFQAYGEAVLAAGAGLAVRTMEAILNTDLKIYEGGNMTFGIAQVEVANLHELDGRLGEINDGLNALAEARGLGLAVLMVTDVVRGTSRLVLAGKQMATLDELPYQRLPDGTLNAPDVVSRKKQLLPAVLGLLA
jgi:manganese-dependent inorganic pyrophosphatase